jgi:hypothetical protein
MNRNVAGGRFPIYKAGKAVAARGPRERHYARFMRLQQAVFFHSLKTSSDSLESAFRMSIKNMSDILYWDSYSALKFARWKFQEL